MRKLLLRKNIWIILSCLLFSVLLTCFCFFFKTKEVQAECSMDGTLESEYFIGEEVSIPLGNFNVDGTVVAASSTITLPDGTMRNSDKIVLEQSGKYTVRYIAQKDNKSYIDVKNFNVYKKLYEVFGNGSAVYGAEEKLESVQGLKVALAEDAVFRLNRKINLNDLKQDEPFIDMHIIPATKGYAELDRIFIKVTDAYDENSFFVIMIKYCDGTITKSTNVSVLGHINSFGTVYSDDMVCPPQQATWTGWNAWASFEGDDSVNDLLSQSLSFYYNSDMQKIFGMDLKQEKVGVLGLTAAVDGWNGFTNGDVYVEVFGKNFRATKANLFIGKIGNVDLQINKLTDNNAPVITVDYGKFTAENYPFAYVNNTYKLFEATAFDANDGTVPTVKSVYYNYYSDKRVLLPVTDNTFKPTRAGVYTIVYTATDKFGNVGEYCIDVTALDSNLAPKLTYEVDGTYETACFVGEYVTLPSVTFAGEVGEFTYETSITKDGKTFDFESETGKFRPMEAGTYTVKYVAVDYVGRICEFHYELVVSVSDLPIFVNNPEAYFQSKYIVGYAYELPNIEAVIVNADNTQTSIPVSVSADNGTIENGAYIPQVAGNITFTVSANYGNKTTQVSLERTAYAIYNDVGIDMKSLFVVDDNVVAEYSFDGFAEYKVTGTGKIEYLNTVLSENVFVKLQTDAQYKEVAEVNVRLYNPMDRSKQVELKLKNFDGLAFASVNGQSFQSVVSGDFSGLNAFEVKYVDTQKAFFVNGLSYSIGENAKGLQSDYAVLEVEAVGISATSVYGLIVEKVGNQPLKNDNVVDIGKPMIACVGDYGGNYLLGSVYTSPKVIAKDMIAPNLTSYTLTITAPDNSIVVIDGMEILNAEVKQYSLELSMYGAYFFEYTAKDLANRKENFRFSINVLDTVSPEVLISGTYTKTGEVGKAVSIAKFIATDNIDAEDKLTQTVFLYKPDGNFEIVKGSFTPLETGRYTVYCYVTDLFGNVGLAYYHVEVK